MLLTTKQIQDIKNNCSLLKVISDQTVTTYLGKSPQIAYALYSLLPNSTSWIYSPNRFNYLETYTILAGELEVRWEGRVSIFRRGDVLNAKDYPFLLTCFAKEEVEILLEMSSTFFEANFEERRIIHRDAQKIQEVDGYTYHHCARIRDYSTELWKRIHPKGKGVARLSTGAYFHDIGKLAIPPEILNKVGKLSEDEWKIIKMHTTLGAEMMRNHELEIVREAAFIVEEHHERYDGKGYPYGLMGEEISLEASIISVVDAFDAMTTNRIYRGAMSFEEAIQEMKDGRGTQFHPEVLDEFLLMLQEKNNHWY